MIDIKKSGYLVRTKSGKLGRTKHATGLINGKLPVYLATDIREKNGIEFPVKFSDTATLCDIKTVTHIGFID